MWPELLNQSCFKTNYEYAQWSIWERERERERDNNLLPAGPVGLGMLGLTVGTPVPPIVGVDGGPYPVKPLPYEGTGTEDKVPFAPGVQTGCWQHGSLGLSCNWHSLGRVPNDGHLRI